MNHTENCLRYGNAKGCPVCEEINRKNDEIEFAQIWHENVRGF